jgi:MFS family permease
MRRKTASATPANLQSHVMRGFPGYAFALAVLSGLLALLLGLWLAGMLSAPVFVEAQPAEGWQALRTGDWRAMVGLGLPLLLWLGALAGFVHFEPRRWIAREIARGTFRPVLSATRHASPAPADDAMDEMEPPTRKAPLSFSGIVFGCRGEDRRPRPSQVRKLFARYHTIDPTR